MGSAAHSERGYRILALKRIDIGGFHMSIGSKIEKSPMAMTNSAPHTLLTPVLGLDKNLKNLANGLILLICDLSALIVSLGLAYLTRIHLFLVLYPNAHYINVNAVENLWWFPVLTLLILAYDGMYHKRYPYWYGVKRIVKAVTWSIVFAVLVMFLLKTSTGVSRTLVVLTFFFAVFLVPLSRYFTTRLLYRMGLWQRPVLILGAGKTAELVIKGLLREFSIGYRPIGLLEDDKNKTGITYGKENVPVLGRFAEVEGIMNCTGVKDIIIATPGMESNRLVELCNRLQLISANVMLVPDLLGIPLAGIKIQHLFDEKTLFLSMQNNLASKWNLLMKRVFDFVVGSIAAVVVLPVIIIIYIALKIEGQGPVIYSGNRIGKDGKEFKCYKFRTMYLDNERILEEYLENNPVAAEQWKKYAKLKDYDPRVTRVGNFLRKTSLDELPQILNVLKGEMSLVGPRPYLQREKEYMGVYAQTILKSSPGITGLWQVSGRNDIDFEGRLQIESWYVLNWSLWLDITLLVRTIGVVLGRRGAY